VLGNPLTEAIVIANRPALHAETAHRVLQAGKHAFVEKPFTLASAEAEALAAEAERRGLVIAVDLELFFASYLHHLRKLMGTAAVRTIAIEWGDPAIEFRHGAIKHVNRDVSTVDEIFPHIWSVLRVLVPDQPPRLRQATSTEDTAHLVFDIGSEATASIRLDRAAAARLRRVAIEFTDGRKLSLDFSAEPGQPLLDGRALPPCPDWDRHPRPVDAALLAFRNAIERGTAPPHAARLCLDSVRLAEAAVRPGQIR
jgi:predicted dehydrogenase